MLSIVAAVMILGLTTIEFESTVETFLDEYVEEATHGENATTTLMMNQYAVRDQKPTPIKP